MREASFGGIIGELMSLLADARRELAVYTLVLGGLTTLGVWAGLTETTAGTINIGFQVDASDSPASGLFGFLLAVAGVVAGYLLMRRLLAVRGRLHAIGNRFWPYVGMAILSTIAVVLGLVLLIVPGMILLVRWSAASGFLVGAGEGITESLRASWHATRGHGWAIFFAAIVLFIGVAVVGGVLGAVFAIAGATVGDAVSAFVEAAAGGIFVAFGVAIYCVVHDDAREISEVFA
jgi:hypothetical protein